MAEQPQIMHALKTELDHPLVEEAIYETLCGIPWTHRKLTLADARTRYVCAVCHSAQTEELRQILNQLIEKHNVLQAAYASHLAKDHRIAAPRPSTPL